MWNEIKSSRCVSIYDHVTKAQVLKWAWITCCSYYNIDILLCLLQSHFSFHSTQCFKFHPEHKMYSSHWVQKYSKVFCFLFVFLFLFLLSNGGVISTADILLTSGWQQVGHWLTLIQTHKYNPNTVGAVFWRVLNHKLQKYYITTEYAKYEYKVKTVDNFWKKVSRLQQQT